MRTCFTRRGIHDFEHSGRPVLVPMVQIGHVRMVMGEGDVPVGVAVGLGDVRHARVLMLVMLVMHVQVLVLQQLVRVLVAVALAHEEDDT